MDLVVDTCIVSSASKRNTPQSNRSRIILDKIYENSHKIVVSMEMKLEYEQIRSFMGPSWFLTMMRAGRVVGDKIDMKDIRFRKDLKIAVGKKYHKSQIKAYWKKLEKDIRFFEAALYSGNVIISNEKVCRDIVRDIANVDFITESIRKLRLLFWIYTYDSNDSEIKSFLETGFTDTFVIPIDWYLLLRSA